MAPPESPSLPPWSGGRGKIGSLRGPDLAAQNVARFCSTFSRVDDQGIAFLTDPGAPPPILSMMSESIVALRTQLWFFSRTTTAMMEMGEFS